MTELILAIWGVVTSLLWSFFYLRSLHDMHKIPFLNEIKPINPAAWPKLSVIIPACNEAKVLEEAVSTLLRQDYPDMEIILIDDRSTDNTGHVVDILASRDPRITPIHIKELPTGWLGKVHALNVGTKVASGEWILFTDADVHFKDGFLRKAVAFSLERSIDHLSVIPEIPPASFWQDIVFGAFAAIYLHITGVANMGNPHSKSFAGSGAFNLVRKSAFDKTEGFAWLKMEVGDDVGVGLMMKRAGFKEGFAGGIDGISVIWYPSLSSMVKGLEKNMFGVTAHYSYLKLLILIPTLWVLQLGPFVAIFHPASLLLNISGLIAYFSMVASGIAWKVKARQNWISAFFIPLGHIILSYIFLRSAFFCLKRSGIIWRGTFYPLSQLRAGQRLKLKM